ncbi:MAG: SUMF1/EgtB/PvdO family nonheme iron enzyme [Bacteroidales bacterium]|nr:SUMF1/EgtB/PvdO family nonheme iron enzyme [Bacteroidales bacterium]
MKTIIIALLGIGQFLNSFSQPNEGIREKPENMEFVPEGTYNMKVIENNKTSDVSVQVSALWMSNEITNKDYREFTDYIRSNPNRFLIVVESEKIILNDSVNGTMKDSVIVKNVFIRYPDILSGLIDSTILEKENMIYKNYFTDEKYDNYPVVGVSYRNAVYYCLWKTEMENARLKQEGKPSISGYRLPTEDEWAYVASQPVMPSREKITGNDIRPSKKGIMNIFQLYNLSDNVAEWTSSYPKSIWRISNTNTEHLKQRIVRGGSWKTSPNINESAELDQDAKRNFIGFRIVRSVSLSGDK